MGRSLQIGARVRGALWHAPLAGMVATEMTIGMGKGMEERKIQPSDIAEAAMLAVRTSNSACPQVGQCPGSVRIVRCSRQSSRC